ncbi:MAG: DegT/DnrJ/EryC1/StrS family aminotransferase [Candidatus Omnitrophica bacterium]|nr:DegT/DnrJ/EryC1/StrS family aminotransferase [Candidatus Omnitrophota bacterium]
MKPNDTKKPFLVFGAPLIEQPEIDEVTATLKSGWIGTGERVACFEQNMRQYKGAKYAAALNSCTSALHLSILAAGIKNGDEVITTAMTFCATVNAIVHAGARPVLADIDPVTMNIDPADVQRKITARTKAIVPVHFAGRPCDMDAIMDIAKERNLKVIEDCAHAIETTYKGRHVGTIGDFGCLSFYATKNIVTGEGGMVLAQNKKHIARIKTLGLHGMSADAWKRFSDKGYRHYYVLEAGFKYNMMDLQAAIGINQLRRIEKYWRRRRQVWGRYQDAFKHLPVTIPAEPEARTRHAYHLYTILIDKERAGLTRDEFLEAMTKNSIGVGVHYLSIPEHPYYQKTFGWKPRDFPNAMQIGRQTTSLPLSPKLTEDNVSYVIATVRKILGR